MDKLIHTKWLKSEFLINKALFQPEEGIPQGGIISPTLANMTLDGSNVHEVIIRHQNHP